MAIKNSSRSSTHSHILYGYIDHNRGDVPPFHIFLLTRNARQQQQWPMSNDRPGKVDKRKGNGWKFYYWYAAVISTMGHLATVPTSRPNATTTNSVVAVVVSINRSRAGLWAAAAAQGMPLIAKGGPEWSISKWAITLKYWCTENDPDRPLRAPAALVRPTKENGLLRAVKIDSHSTEILLFFATEEILFHPFWHHNCYSIDIPRNPLRWFQSG